MTASKPRSRPASPGRRPDILVDEQFGAAILRDASGDGYTTACPAEKSGQEEFDFEYGEEFARHIEAVQPTFCKVLVRYNPEGDRALNQKQAARLKRLSDYLHTSGRSKFMFELLVPPEKSQLDQVKGDKKAYDLQTSSKADGGGNPATSGRPGRAGRLEDRRTRSPGRLRESCGRCAAGRTQQCRLHHPGPRRE